MGTPTWLLNEAVLAEVTAWQSRPLEPLYPVVFFDALRVKIDPGCQEWTP